MIRSTWILAGLMVSGACAASRVEPSPPAPSVSPAPDPEPPHATGMTGALVGSHSIAAGGGAGTVLASPAEGSSNSMVTGCLAATTEAEGARFTPPAVTRSSGPAVTATLIRGGVSVTHQLTHACCLKGQVSTQIDGSAVVVREVLSGNPCRCMCASTLRTAIGLAPGHWTLTVEVEQDGHVERIPVPPVDVPKT